MDKKSVNNLSNLICHVMDPISILILDLHLKLTLNISKENLII